jgi:hypothetical protein
MKVNGTGGRWLTNDKFDRFWSEAVIGLIAKTKVTQVL